MKNTFSFVSDAKNNTTRCPFCNLERVNLKGHLMRIHGLNEENALAAKSQYGLRKRKLLPEDTRKSKHREYPRLLCPVTGCSKTPVRIENHLRDTQNKR